MAGTPWGGSKASQRVTGGRGGVCDGPKQSHEVFEQPLTLIIQKPAQYLLLFSYKPQVSLFDNT